MSNTCLLYLLLVAIQVWKEIKTSVNCFSVLYLLPIFKNNLNKVYIFCRLFSLLFPKMCKDNVIVQEGFTDSWAICCYVFLVSLLCEGINVSNGVLMVNTCNQIYEYVHTHKNNSFILPFKIIIALANVVILLHHSSTLQEPLNFSRSVWYK